ncbi:uncharacterized protein LOC106011200 [Aplysia californica]|uniref:Uncharacterized protein LOC106011200 n=1 Tax=Aplysia californica TaxID=6500 RepID=A0ABM0ZVK8_APLCA|nr:uncharacterized protein LOC106011200 [Aplysia californica]
MFQQSRMMQRMATGRGSPRAPQSPFGTSPPDPLLISPQAVMSPNSAMRQPQQPGVQVSPQFNQVPMSSGFSGQSPNMSGGPGSFPGGPAIASGAPSFSAGSMTQSTASALQEFDMQYLDTSLNSMESKNVSGDAMGAGSSKSQYVKQELRNICSARSEKQQQQQQQQQQSQMQAMDFETSSELPLEILETIKDMSKDHGGPLSTMDEEEVVLQSREEAKRRVLQFRKLSNATIPVPVPEQSDDAEVKATSLFRNQLLRPVLNSQSPSGNKQMAQASGKNMESQVSIQQAENRTSLESIRPADNTNSLLCQLLSE